MCVKWILDKMGQFRTYNDINLSNRLVRAQQDLTELKTSQLYLMQSTKGFEIPTTGKYNFVNTTYGEFGLRTVLTFTGDKPNKQVLFFPNFTVYNSSGAVVDLNNLNNNTHCMNYFIWSDPEKPNVMYAFIDIMSSLSGRPSMTFGGIANDNGTLTVDAWSTYVEA